MHLAQRSFYNASIQYLLCLLVKVIGLLLLVRSTAVDLYIYVQQLAFARTQ